MMRRSNSFLAGLTTPEIHNCIRALGPKVYFEKKEQYFMGTVDAYLKGCTLQLPDKPAIKSPTAADLGTAPKTASLNLDDKSLKKGDLNSAVALVHARQPDDDVTELQFWLFYPYNGGGTVQVNFKGFDPIGPVGGVAKSNKSYDLAPFGEHYGDWEGIILRVKNEDKSLIGVRKFAHGKVETFEGTEIREKISFEAGRPVFFASRNGHATYTSEGENPTERTELWGKTDVGVGELRPCEIYFRNITNKGKSIDLSSKYSLIAVDFDPSIVPPQWLEFAGRWGQVNDSQGAANTALLPVYLGLEALATVVSPFKKDFGRRLVQAKEDLQKAAKEYLPEVLPAGPRGPKIQRHWESNWNPEKHEK